MVLQYRRIGTDSLTLSPLLETSDILAKITSNAQAPRFALLIKKFKISLAIIKYKAYHKQIQFSKLF